MYCRCDIRICEDLLILGIGQVELELTNLRSPVAFDNPYNSSGRLLFRCPLGRVGTNCLFLCLDDVIIFNIIILESCCRNKKTLITKYSNQKKCYQVRTILIDNFVCGRFPLFFLKHLYDNDITLNRPIHVFAANEQDRFGERWYWDAPLTSAVSITSKS